MEKKPQKTAKNYNCKVCHFVSSDKKDYNRHILTAKHIQLTAVDFSLTEKNRDEIVAHICSACNKIYKSKQGLWKHKKTCIEMNNNNKLFSQDKTSIHVTEMMTIIHQNQEFKNMILEQHEKIMDLTHKCSVTNNITNMNTNNTMNNQFNINMFLNETCKDALNISDFVDTLKINFENLEYVGTNGYVNGITKIIMDGLDKLDIYQRPIHCTDKKRETLYIKDNDVWEKDTENKDKIRRFVGGVAKKNLNMVSPWQHSYPGIDVLDSPAYNLYMKIMRESINCGGRQEQADRNDARIIKNIVSRVYVDKHIETIPSIL